MRVLSTPQHYLFNLETTSSQEAKRLWRRKIKESWDYECAYCGSGNNLTIDHIVPRSKGGTDFTKNDLTTIVFITQRCTVQRVDRATNSSRLPNQR